MNAYDPDFGFPVRGSSYDQRIPVPPPPYAHVFESQSAMSMLMMQMAREMNQRNAQQAQQQPVQPVSNLQPTTQQGVGQQPQGYAPREMKMDEKWIPSMPVPQWKQWNTRGKELYGFKEWLDVLPMALFDS